MIYNKIGASGKPKVNGTITNYVIASGLEILKGQFVSIVSNQVQNFNGSDVGIAMKKGSSGEIIPITRPN